MVKFDVEKIVELSTQPDQIRNISIIAHVDHGKTTITQALITGNSVSESTQVGNLISQRSDEIIRGITIKSSAISLCHKLSSTSSTISTSSTSSETSTPQSEENSNICRTWSTNNNNENSENSENSSNSSSQEMKIQNDTFLINMIDTPGHVDFNADVISSLRITDGALVIVDAVEGVCVQTSTVLRQALQERVKPCLLINKVDRLIQQLNLTPEEAYIQLSKVIETINAEIASFVDDESEQVFLDPVVGNVAFASGFQNWGFTLDTFAKKYSSKFKVDPAKLKSKLFGENYFDSERKVWTKNSTSSSGKKLERGFCQFILNPIFTIFKESQDEKNRSEFEKKLNSLNIKLTPSELEKPSKEVLKISMQRFIPLAENILDMIVLHLPSPKIAQAYRTKILYTGDMNDKYATAIKECDSNGPLIIYISKMMPIASTGRFLAFGRVFSGIAKSGAKIRIHTQGEVVSGKTLQRTVLMLGKFQEVLDQVCCGNIVGIVGVDKFMLQRATIMEDTAIDASPFVDIKFTVAPVVSIAVEPKNPTELPKLVEGLKKLARADSLLVISKNQAGENVISGAGELHLEICTKDLVEFSGIELKMSNPITTYKETITEKSERCLSKSANKLNRIYANAEPISEDLIKEIENGTLGITGKAVGKSLIATAADISRSLVENFSFDPNDAKKVWCFGPEQMTGNMVVDQTKAVQYLSEARESIVGGFNWAIREGPLCEENVRGVRLNILDVELHRDSIHRSGNQTLPATRRVTCASILTAKPKLVEPMYIVTLQSPNQHKGAVYSIINQRRAEIISEEMKFIGSNIIEIKAYLPVSESIGLVSNLRAQSQGKVFSQLQFSHWKTLESDPLEKDSRANKIITEIRERKGIEKTIPPLDRFLDKL